MASHQHSFSAGRRAQADSLVVPIPSSSITPNLPSRRDIGLVSDATHVRRYQYREWDRDAHGRESVQRAAELISAAVASKQRWTVEGIASQVGISAGHLHRLFKKHMNLSPKAFAGTQCMQTTPTTASQVTPPEQVKVNPYTEDSSIFQSIDFGGGGLFDSPLTEWDVRENNLLDDFMAAGAGYPTAEQQQEWPWYTDDGVMDFSSLDLLATDDGPITNSESSHTGLGNSAYMV